MGALAGHTERLPHIGPGGAVGLPGGRDLDACQPIGGLRELQRHRGTGQAVGAEPGQVSDESPCFTGDALIMHGTGCHRVQSTRRELELSECS